MSKKCIYFSSLFYSYRVFGYVAISFRCAFLRGIECFLLRKNIWNFADATRENRFTTMTPLGMSRDVTCHRLWRHNCFSNSIQFELIHFISIWTSQNLFKIRTFLCIRKRNELFDHPSYHNNVVMDTRPGDSNVCLKKNCRKVSFNWASSRENLSSGKTQTSLFSYRS